MDEPKRPYFDKSLIKQPRTEKTFLEAVRSIFGKPDGKFVIIGTDGKKYNPPAWK